MTAGGRSDLEEVTCDDNEEVGRMGEREEGCAGERSEKTREDGWEKDRGEGKAGVGGNKGTGAWRGAVPSVDGNTAGVTAGADEK